MSTTSIPGFVPTTPPASTTAQSGINSLSSSDFLNLMIQQLQQQDPLNPTDSNQLLSQMSQISTLQSNTQMEQSLTGLTLQQSIGAGSNLIGKTISGVDSTGANASGVVTGVQVKNNLVNLTLNNNTNETMPLGNVLTITPTPLTGGTGGTTNGTSSSTTGTNAALTNLINSLQSIGL